MLDPTTLYFLTYLLISNAIGTYAQIRIWNLSSWECECAFSGHRTAVTALCFTPSGTQLASGSQDTDVILWDVSGETGLFRLKGHRGQITGVAFLGGVGAGRLVSVSKDETMRVWDLDTQHCCQTVISRGGELWSVTVDHSRSRLALGATDSELRVYSIDAAATTEVLCPMGSLRRATNERVATVQYLTGGTEGSETTLLVCQGAGKVIEVWQRRTEAEAQKRLKRRKRRRREKNQKKQAEDNEITENYGTAANDNDDANDEVQDTLSAVDEHEVIGTVRSKHKVVSSALQPSKTSLSRGRFRLVLSLASNMLEVWDFQRDETPSRTFVVDGAGHRSDVRAIAVSSDDAMCLSTSNSGVKVWNPRTGACLRTIEAGYGLSTVFAPGNRHAVVATKEGRLEVVDINAGVPCYVQNEAHAGPIWSVAALPDGSGVVTGGADKELKFWEWELGGVDEENDSGDGKHTETSSTDLRLSLVKTVTMTDDVLCVKISPNGKFVAVALLDATIRVFFLETMKFFLSLYGHKLPVLSMDISSDGSLLASGSADKNLKIWGLDFGDCHRSFFAHSDSVMAVAFVPGTHYVFTGGKDGIIKYWDVDKFEHLLTLEGHCGEIWSLAVSSLGDYVVSGSHDRSLRRWERTDEPFFVEEEKEKRLESMFEEDVDANVRQPLGPDGKVMEPGEAGTVEAAGRKTMETVSAADSLVEALDIAISEEKRMQEDRTLKENPLLMGLTPSEYVLRSLEQVRGSDLEQALLLVPFTDALSLLNYLTSWLKRTSKIELVCRATVLLLRVHMQEIMSTPSARPLLGEMRSLLHQKVQGYKDTMGFNLAGLEHLKRMVNENKTVTHVESAAGAIALLKRKAEDM